jgi:predicted tellurium resistance membrane protein TerC|tara:strand:+ start:2111 stop:2824 length:714 start_codon:yes stop_codon:yes gene_type:complete
MELLLNPEILIALLTLTALEIVLGIDNIIFISILASRLPVDEQKFARTVGLGVAMLMRLLLLFSISLIMRLTAPLLIIFSNEISGRDLILIIGGIFLLVKSTLEIYHNVEGDKQHQVGKIKASFTGVILQIMVMDLIFSLDSVITAIGLVDQIWIMVVAVVIAVVFMMIFVNAISHFIEEHPSIKILALSFLLLVGLALIGDGLDMHIPKGYIYFSMLFSTYVQLLNIRMKKKKLAN